MLTFDDCVAMSGLSKEEVAAIAKREHLPEIVALELATSRTEPGSPKRNPRREATAASGDRSSTTRMKRPGV